MEHLGSPMRISIGTGLPGPGRSSFTRRAWSRSARWRRWRTSVRAGSRCASEEEPGAALAPAAGPNQQVVESRNGRVRIGGSDRRRAPILADQFYPGWRATLDGEPAPLLAANYILRAVPVPAGRHTVTMTYRPVTFLLGLYLSLAAVSLLLAIATASAIHTRAR